MTTFILGLVGASAVAAAAAGIARRAGAGLTAPGARGRYGGLLLGGAVAAGALLLFQNVLVHDALWYYTYLRSAIVDLDLDLYAEFALRNPHGMYLPPPGTPIFHLGTALVAAPLALAVRPVALWLRDTGILPGGDGYGALEILAVTFTSVLLAAAALALTHRLARRVVPAGAALLAVAALLYASPLAWFAFVWPAYPHAASAALAALFLLLWHTRGADLRPATMGLLGLVGGGLVLVHPQDAIYLALPLIDLALAARRRGASARGLAAGGGALIAGALAGFAPQMAAWMAAAGAPIQDVYGAIGDPFRFGHPAVLEVLFSGYNGLITWTPLCGVAIGGLFLLRHRDPRLFRGLLLIVVLEVWAIGSYGYWWGGASFGARYFLSAWPALGVGLAAAVAAVTRRAGASLAAALAAPFVYWNLLLMAQFRLEWIPHNRPPDFAAALGRQVTEAPAALLAGLGAPFRWNRVLVLDTLAAALEARSPAGVALWAVLVGAGTALLLAWCAWLAAARAPSVLSGRRAVFCGAGGAAIATLAVALVAVHPGSRRITLQGDPLPRTIAAGRGERIALSAPTEGPTEATPTAVALAAHRARRPAAGPGTLNVISFLRQGAPRREGDAVADLTVEGRGCAAARYALRAGLETAETAPGRIEARDLMRHDTGRADPVQRWWQDDLSSRHYWGQAYLATFLLPQSCEPEAIRLMVAPGPGELVVRTVIVSEDGPGGGMR